MVSFTIDVEITVEKINTKNNPYQLFLDSIKDSETKQRYKNQLHSFLKLIPNQIYKESLGEIPVDNQREILAKCFVNTSMSAILEAKSAT